MSLIAEKLASALGQKEQDANIALAAAIAAGKDSQSVSELVGALAHKKKAIRHDSIKVLYETAALIPELLVPHATVMLDLLTDKDNRLQWGAMTALSAMAPSIPETIYRSLDQIIAAADTGSVITRDHAVRILVSLSHIASYRKVTLPLLIEQIQQSPPNQAPSYAEQALAVTDNMHKPALAKALHNRLPDIESASKKKRIEKVLKKL